MVKLGWVVVALLSTVAMGGAMRAASPADSPPPGAFARPQQGALNSVQAVDHASLPGGRIMIRVIFRYELSDPPSVMVHYQPAARIVFDFANTVSAVGKEPIVAGQPGVRSLRVAQTGTRTRLLIDLTRTFLHDSTLKGKELLITLQRPETTDPGESRRWWSSDAAADAPKHEVRDVVFQRSPTGEGRIIVEQSDAAIPVEIRQQGEALIVDFLDSALPPQLERRLDVLDFGTAIRAIETYRVGRHVRMKIELAGSAGYSAYQVSRRLTVSAR